jgi:hypothetical protein
MVGMRMPETCWAVFKRQAIKLRDLCIWLVDLFEYLLLLLLLLLNLHAMKVLTIGCRSQSKSIILSKFLKELKGS